MMTSRHALFLTVVLATQTAFSAVLTAAERPAAAAATIPNAEAAKVDDPKAGGKVLAALFAGATTDANEAERRKLPDLLSVADVRESLRLARADYEQAAAIADLPAAERRSRWADFEAGISKAGPAGSREQAMRAISAMFLPATAKVCEKVDEANVRRQLLLQAIKAKR